MRDYGLPPQVWGGEQHEHEWAYATRPGQSAGTASPKVQIKGADNFQIVAESQHAFCACGAWLGSLGLEPTPELYVEHLVSVFREVRRVLRPDGCVFVNLGDSYAGSGKGPPGVDGFQSEASNVAPAHRGVMAGRAISGQQRHVVAQASYKPKDLLGMPWMVAFALRADGWYLRSEIIWSKPSPMPESVTDRPTKAHETVFLLAKSRTYFYDADAIREPAQDRPQPAADQKTVWAYRGPRINNAYARGPSGYGHDPVGRNKRSVWEIASTPFSDWTPSVRQVPVALGDADDDTKRRSSPDCPVHGDQSDQASSAQRDGRVAASEEQPRSPDSGIRHAQAPLPDCEPIDWRREREIEASTLDWPGQRDEFAAIPNSTESRRTGPAPETSQPCTPSAQSLGDTPHNGAVRDSADLDDRTSENSSGTAASDDPRLSRTQPHTAGTSSGPSLFVACTCSYYKEVTESVSHFATFPPKLVEPMLLAGSRPGDHVLDPFGGAGTTGLVADRLGRDCTLIELNPAYAQMARDRITGDSPLFAEVVA